MEEVLPPRAQFQQDIPLRPCGPAPGPRGGQHHSGRQPQERQAGQVHQPDAETALRRFRAADARTHRVAGSPAHETDRPGGREVVVPDNQGLQERDGGRVLAGHSKAFRYRPQEAL